MLQLCVTAYSCSPYGEPLLQLCADKAAAGLAGGPPWSPSSLPRHRPRARSGGARSRSVSCSGLQLQPACGEHPLQL